MENNEKMMTGEESFRIITEMINKTKVNIRQGSFHLLFWGWLIFAISLSEYLLTKLSGFAHPYYVWMLVIPGVFVSMIYGFATGRKTKVHTYADMLYMWTWMGFLIAAVVLFIVHSKRLDTVAPYILLLAGFPTFVSGFIIKFRPLIAGGICFWIFALVISFAGPSIAPLGIPVSMLTGYLIPGYMLRNKIDHDKV
ncbi:MAG: hypothetical protein EPN88_09120 [Bacteroidetes bacterium]|nr:MAG: hypothetical protein EPN88_09120 [Bacteroidota bacterium]